MTLKEWLHLKRLYNSFSGVISKEALDRIIESKDEELQMESVTIDFIVILIRDEPIEKVPMFCSQIMQQISANKGVAISVASSLVVAIFGFPLGADNRTANRRECVESLMNTLKEDIKLIHGKSSGFLGNLGTAQSMHYSALIPKFNDILKQLCEMDFGRMNELL